MEKVKELVVTLRASTGDVVKVAELKASGERRDLAEQEFADLIARGEEESLVAALEKPTPPAPRTPLATMAPGM